MKSLVILMIEEEQPEGISARKLVAETAKHNVITAYNPTDGFSLLRRFPKVDVILIHQSILTDHPELIAETRKIDPGLPIIVATPYGYSGTEPVDCCVDSHNPQELLRILGEKIQRRWPD
ncbi:MAG TPA: response regulator [Terracidiphilus sp.]